MSARPAIAIERLTYRYGKRTAVDDLTLDISVGEVFAFLGPNGSGKSTLFRVLSTLVPVQAGSIVIFGVDGAREPRRASQYTGVVFQSPSLDKKLTVAENLWHQGRLYGMPSAAVRRRSAELLAAVGLEARSQDRVETLSGGMRRRAELAKCMLHRPQLLVLDEPSTGLDPAARLDLWQHLTQLRDSLGTTIVLTTHLLDEADRADRIAILHLGRLVALGQPWELCGELGGDSITIRTEKPTELRAAISARFDLPADVVDGVVRLERPNGHEWIPRLVEAFPGDIQAITLGKPTLEDVFISRTGHRFEAERDLPGRPASPLTRDAP
ncbi:MAG TPA: ABC transporter ATP-binding protein [Lacipirellulaceae bacterium]|nr:ABC transporter ATP-binding protein [Lacipirellulaceae bacterium]HMP05619.1 ABC transporter ATP-binding protein [Lacipirellulaceae bacterium]